MSILFLAHRVPYPPDRGDKIRSYHVLRYLAARTPVHLFAFADDSADETPRPVLHALTASCTIVPRRKGRVRATLEALGSGRAASLTAFDSPAMHAAVAAAPSTTATYCFSGQMAQYLPRDRPAVMDFVDVDSAKFAQLAPGAALPLRPLLRREARLLGAFERNVAARVRASLFVTDAEAAMFRTGGGTGRIEVVENGIDGRFFDPAGEFPRLTHPGPLIVMTGRMDYQPNIDGARWFADAVLPKVREQQPDAQFAIVGRSPAPAVLGLAKRAGVVVTGGIPDVRPWLAAASVCVAPLKLARGLQNKVLEAMAMARPVIASPAAAEGIDHGGTVAIADGPEEWLARVGAVLASPRDNTAGRQRVLARYDWAARLAPLDSLLGLDTPERAAA